MLGLKRWQVYYWTKGTIPNRETRSLWERNVMGEIEALDFHDAAREAQKDYGPFREVGYRLRVRRV